MKTEELIALLERAKDLPGARGWGRDAVAEIIKRLEELEELRVRFEAIKVFIREI